MNKKIFKKISINSPIILSFTAICFIALILNYITAGRTNDILFSTYKSSAMNPLTYIRVIGHVFGHVGWNHLISNIMLILVIGPLLEEKYGSLNILMVIGVTAVITGVFNNMMFSNIQLLGASGVVFAFILLSSFTSLKEGTIPLTLILVIIIYMSGEIYNGLFTVSNISHITHILGGLVGAVLGYIMNKSKWKY